MLQVTTASSAAQDKGYWGYRLIALRPDGRVEAPPFSAPAALPSTPSGHLWVVRRPQSTAPKPPGVGTASKIAATVFNGWTRPARMRLRLRLPRSPGGYRFEARTPGAKVALQDVVPLQKAPGAHPKKPAKEAIYELLVTLPPAGKLLPTAPSGYQATPLAVTSTSGSPSATTP